MCVAFVPGKYASDRCLCLIRSSYLIDVALHISGNFARLWSNRRWPSAFGYYLFNVQTFIGYIVKSIINEYFSNFLWNTSIVDRFLRCVICLCHMLRQCFIQYSSWIFIKISLCIQIQIQTPHIVIYTYIALFKYIIVGRQLL